MTPTDDEILAAARDAGINFDDDQDYRARVSGYTEGILALYRHAYAAGMEAAAVIAAEVADGLAPMGAAFYSGAAKSADAIRAANGREGKA